MYPALRFGEILIVVKFEIWTHIHKSGLRPERSAQVEYKDMSDIMSDLTIEPLFLLGTFPKFRHFLECSVTYVYYISE